MVVFALLRVFFMGLSPFPPQGPGKGGVAVIPVYRHRYCAPKTLGQIYSRRFVGMKQPRISDFSSSGAMFASAPTRQQLPPLSKIGIARILTG